MPILGRSAIAIASLVIAFGVPIRVLAFSFDANHILSDHTLTNAQTMSLGDVARWLQERGSLLANVFQPDSSGSLKFPHEILWLAAQEATINPQVLLVMLQKEQGLIDGRSPKQSQYDWAMGYGCPDGSGCNARFQGFGKQVRGAALQFQGYLEDLATKGETIARWSVGRAKQTADGYTVTPATRATAALYSYTPWRGNGSGVGGNYSFARLFAEWFGAGRYPDGAVLRSPDGAVWRISQGKRQRFASLPVLHSYVVPEKVIVATDADVTAYREGPPVRFVNYSVLEDAAGVRWLIADSTRRRIASSDVFRKLGFNPEEVEPATAEDLSAYEEGAPISAPDDSPRGMLVMDTGTGKEYLVTGNTKHLIPHPAIREARFPGQRIQPRLPAQLASLATGASVTLPDGELVTAPKALPQAFVISQGKRRAFSSPRVLEQLGYSWANIRVLSNDAFDLHPEGQPLTGGFDGGATTTAPIPPPAAQATPAAAQGSVIIHTHGLSLF